MMYDVRFVNTVQRQLSSFILIISNDR